MNAFEMDDANSAPRLRTNRVEPFALAALADSGYEVLRKLGSGGMGIVYLVRDAENRQYALKVLRPDISDDAAAKERLRREVQTLQKVRSENVAQVLDFELETDSAFIVTEFVPGPTLDEAVKNFGALHLEVVRELGVILGEALQEIHALGIVHRDLKPSNVMLRHARSTDLTDFDADGSPLEPVLIDFGIALAAEDSRLTSTGLMMGTAAYLDPAVVKTNETTEQADWWSWAALLAYAATGRDPFGTGRFDLVFLRAERGEVDVEGLPSAMQNFLRQALNPDPALRPAPQEMLEQLARLDFSANAVATEVLDPQTVLLNQPAATLGESTELLPEQPVAISDPTEVIGAQTELLELQSTDSFEFDSAGAATEVIPVATEPETKLLPQIDLVAQSTSPASSQFAPHNPPLEQLPGDYLNEAEFADQNQAFAPAPALTPANYPGMVAPVEYLTAPEHRTAPKHPWLVLICSLVLIALGALAPIAAMLILIALVAAARTWQRGWVLLTRTSEQGGSTAVANTKIGFATLPWLLWGVIEALLLALFPVALGLAFLVGLDAALVWSGVATPSFAYYGAAILLIAILNFKWGFGSKTTRNGVRRILDASAPERLWGFALFCLLAVLCTAICYLVYSRGGSVDYFPLFNQQPLETWLPWRA